MNALVKANRYLSKLNRIELVYQNVAIDPLPRDTLPSKQALLGRIAPGVQVLKQQKATLSVRTSVDVSMHCHKHVMELK